MIQSIEAAAPPVDDRPGSGLEAFARQLHWERRLRTIFLPQSLFGEAGWDLLLDLYAGGGARLPKVGVGALRALLRHGFVAIEGRRSNGRSLILTADARTRIEQLLQEIWFNRASHDAGPPPASEVAGRTGRIDALIATLSVCQDELDALQLWQPGADVSQALEVLKSSRAAQAWDDDAFSAGYP